MIVMPVMSPDTPVKSKHSSSQLLLPLWVSTRSSPCVSILKVTGTERDAQTFIVYDSPSASGAAPPRSTVLPPNGWPGNFCICTTLALVLMPLASGLAMIVDSPPSKLLKFADPDSKSTETGPPPPPPPPGGTSVMSSK